MGNFDLDECIAKLIKGQLLAEPLIIEICRLTTYILCKESNVLSLSTPITIVGDIHGQFYDLLEIFKIGGSPPNTNYLFLGDYVDRGYHSIETMSLLICYKLRYPSRIHLIRGNHESRTVTQTYGFYTECLKKYDSSRVWASFTNLFDALTLSAIIDNSIFCVHGGLSPYVNLIDQIKLIDRYKEIPHEGLMADLVWSDPDASILDFGISPRGAGYTFGQRVVEIFLSNNKLDTILRAHQLCMEGYQVLFKGKLATVWSAPNYCYRCGNLASILELDNGNYLNWNEAFVYTESRDYYDSGVSNNLDSAASCKDIQIYVANPVKEKSQYNCFNIFDAAPDNERYSKNFNGDTKEITEYFL